MGANWRQIAHDLAERIGDGRLRAGERLPTEFVLAEELGVSRGTVHRALTDLKSRGLLARQRRNGTIVNGPVASRTGRIALIVDHANDFPQTELLRGIQSALPNESGVLLFDVGGDPAAEADQIRRAAATTDGILIYPMCDPANTPLLRDVAATGFPIVLLDRIPEGLELDAVLSDNYEVTRAAMDSLVAAGHRRVVFLSGDNPQVSSVNERHRAYRDATEAIGAYDPGLERWFAKEMERKPARLDRAMEDALFTMLSRPEPPTLLFCVQDLYAAAAAEALDALGLPSRPEILTFNDWPPMMLREAGAFHRIVQRPYEIGRAATERLRRPKLGAERDREDQRVAVRPVVLLAAVTLLGTLLGCSKEVTSADIKPVDPYPGLKGQQRVDAIRNDPKINSMDRATKIAEAQKAAGLPATGS